MMTRCILFSLTLLIFSFSQSSLASSVKVDVTLSPAGSFAATTNKVKGKAFMMTKNNKQLVAAKGIEVDVQSLSTGIALRDDHLKDRLQSKKFPAIKLISAKGMDGKGEADLSIMGKRHKVKGSYKIEDNTLKASFPIKLSDLKIENIRYMGIGVKDEVVVNVDVPIEVYKAKAAAK